MLDTNNSQTPQGLSAYEWYANKVERENAAYERALAIAGYTGNGIEKRRPANTTPALEAAMGYTIHYGWKVFPADVARKKSYLSAEYAPGGMRWGMTNDPAQLERNFMNKKWRDVCGVGIPTGKVNGIFDIEADTKKGHGVDGLASLQELEIEHGLLPDTLMAESPSASPHRLYKHPGGKVKSSDNEIAPGVDIKGDGGMFVAPPSKRKDGTYRWLNDLPIADAPQWLINLVTDDSKPQAPAGNGTGSAYEQYADAQDAERFEASIEEVVAALAVIPNDDLPWHDWNKIGMATWRATKGSAEGFDAFDTFSEKSLKYDQAVTIEKWQKITGCPPTDIGFGTLKRLADEASPGWQLKVQKPKQIKQKLFQTSAQFVANFVPPDYLIDGLLQRRYVYSLTSPTGGGKTSIALRIAAHVTLGLPLAEREVEKGRVLFFAGENPDDVRTRWIKLCEEMDLDPNTADVVFMPFTLHLSDKEVRAQIDGEAAEHGPFSLLIVDTSAAYYSGNDENDNVALGDHARMLRTFKELPGGPTILVTCHPVKSANMENLQPRGGGAFIAEIDGNLVCIKDAATMTVEVTTHGKFRGPDFAPFSFKLKAAQSAKLVDTKGRSIWSIFAEPISKDELENIADQGRANQDQLLGTMQMNPGISLHMLAELLEWKTTQGEPNKQKVHRVMMKLKQAKLVEQGRDESYKLTKRGEEEVAAERAKHTVVEGPPIEGSPPKPTPTYGGGQGFLKSWTQHGSGPRK